MSDSPKGAGKTMTVSTVPPASKTPTSTSAATTATKAERNLKRLEAWRKRQKETAAIAAASQPPPPPPPPPPPLPPPMKKTKVVLSLGMANIKMKKKKKKKKKPGDANGSTLLDSKKRKLGGTSMDNQDGDYGEESNDKRQRLSFISFKDISNSNSEQMRTGVESKSTFSSLSSGTSKKKRTRWDLQQGQAHNKSQEEQPPPTNDRMKYKGEDDTSTPPLTLSSSSPTNRGGSMKDYDDNSEDDLDKFMNDLNSGVQGFFTPQIQEREKIHQQKQKLSIGSPSNTASSTIAHQQHQHQQQPNNSLILGGGGGGGKGGGLLPLKTNSGGVITPEELALLHNRSPRKKVQSSRTEDDAVYGPSDWESEAASASEIETDDEEEEKARREFLKALQKSNVPTTTEPQHHQKQQSDQINQLPQLASEVKSQKNRQSERMLQLQKEASEAMRQSTQSSQPDIGRIYYQDVESGVMEEAERTLSVLRDAQSQNALQVLAELNKKKELKNVDHSSVEYISIRKNLYTVPRDLAWFTEDDVAALRAKLGIRVRGRGAPSPTMTFAQCGLSERILAVLTTKLNIAKPFPIQAQCLPCIMAGRDVIGIAKTGSGKTLAYLLPMLRHIGDQPGLDVGESGPVGLVLAPARELAVQIHSVTKLFCKHLGFKSTAVYGGAGVAEQIADLKRGAHIVVATPGRMIDILTMQSGKILSLRRVSYVVLDEADRMFDMGFAPQISAILSAVRPDRQTVLFSATFPKAVEALARKSLRVPIEVLVGGKRSVASDSVLQHAELVEESDKFLRLLQLLGDHIEDGKKAIVFVDTQNRADMVFEQLVRCGYPSSSLHGGKEQEDRDSTLADFKRADGPSVLVATSVAGRGLDVRSVGCVINYSAPNHLEDYVHRVGRTGRADEKGVAYTLVNSGDEAKHAPNVVRAMVEAGQGENISESLRKLADEFKGRVERGEARYAGSGFKGKGYSYDSSELSEAQKLVQLEKRQARIEAGMMDPDEDDPTLRIGINGAAGDDVESSTDVDPSAGALVNMQANLSADVLALPGMKEAILKKAGIEPSPSQTDPGVLSGGGTLSTGSNHFVEEIEINAYPREARWKVTQKETTVRLQDEFQTAVTLKGKYIAPSVQPEEGERRLYLHLEATSDRVLQTCIQEVRRLLNEETLRVGSKGLGGGGHRYNVLG